MQQNSFETFYQINELTIACQRLQNNATKVIALHGWQDNSNSFVPLMSQLSHFDWYAIDFPGHGKSDWRNSQAHYYFIDYVDDVFRLKQQIAANEQVIIIGHSMGAMVANLFAACFPEHVKAVIAIEGIACVTTDENEVTTQLKNAILNRTDNKPKRVFSSFEQIVKARIAVSDLNKHQASLLMERNVEKIETGYKLCTDPKLKHHSGFRFTPNQCIEMCKNIITPMLVIKATNGYSLVNQGIEIYGKYILKLMVNEISGGHHCHIEFPNEAAKLINVYVNEMF
ncbi:alpha/beta hydrolase [Pseudoalteromonas sp.]|uniref:alpha/beta hydrolase n=1 Tax=Pseudoalteromonas sp. TaxID=53249 RepID=UPI003563FAD5